VATLVVLQSVARNVEVPILALLNVVALSAAVQNAAVRIVVALSAAVQNVVVRIVVVQCVAVQNAVVRIVAPQSVVTHDEVPNAASQSAAIQFWFQVVIRVALIVARISAPFAALLSVRYAARCVVVNLASRVHDVPHDLHDLHDVPHHDSRVTAQ
jgi:hypothetical protein